MFAYQKEPKLQLALLERIFEAYFEQEKDIGSHEMLAALAEDAGIASKAEVRNIPCPDISPMLMAINCACSASPLGSRISRFRQAL